MAPTMPDLELPILGLAPSLEEQRLYKNVHMTPAAGKAYSYTTMLPGGWFKLADPPSADAVPTTSRFISLGLFSPFDPPLPPVTVNAAARLWSPCASVADAFIEYCAAEGFEVLLVRPQQYASGKVVEGLVTQDARPLGTIKMRMAMFEDGGRLFLLASMAPAALYHDFLRDLSLAMVTFELDLPQGNTVPLLRP